ncbi:hypothetical protein [Dyadobacter sp. CY347]|uniref:hypothetical protein n=1 Tax=Dyadobacter sp. CY347 TaxID=2909336 RepID=UPI001F1CE9FD|nr:hypothetical protein [Dyadobacter sp. CY347]MCF2488751.1 hypothetical protein [Dyadobacter sp. CY347]
MGLRKVVIRQSVSESIAAVALFIESKGLIQTADKFTDEVYDFILKLAHFERSFGTCRDPDRAFMGFKCIVYKKKYTIVFIETSDELNICEFIPSRLIHW